MSTLGERIKRVRGGATQAEFATRIGISKAALGGYERDENLPGVDVISKICKKCNISPEWLVLGHGGLRPDGLRPDELRPDGLQQYGLQQVELLQEGLREDAAPYGVACAAHVVMIPMVEATVSAGAGGFDTAGACVRSYPFLRDFLERKGNPRHMVLMRVRGDSMQPEIMDNDVVLLDRSKKQAMPGPIFAVGFEDAVYLKRVDFLPGKVILKSVNPAYPALTLDVRGQDEPLFRVVGQVLWVGREYK